MTAARTGSPFSAAGKPLPAPDAANVALWAYVRARRPVERPVMHGRYALVLRSVDWDARSRALAHFVHATGAWVEKARKPKRGGVPDAVKRRVEEAVRRLPRDRPLTKRELDEFVRSLAGSVGRELWDEYQRRARRTYLFGLEEVNRETGADLQFGGVHPRVLDALTRGDYVSEAFSGLHRETSGAITNVLREQMAQGVTSPATIARRMEDEVRGVSRRRLETIARTENYRILETARAVAYREAEVKRGEQFQYGWGRDLGPTRRGNPQCVVCTEIIDGIPAEGMSLAALIAHMEKVITSHKPKWNPTKGGTFPNPHPSCRHGMYRVVLSQRS